MECAVATVSTVTAAKSGASSAEKPGVFAWHSIGWQISRFNKLTKHELVLQKDLLVALENKSADVVMLCECGEIGTGLGPAWEDVVRRCCGPDSLVTHQSHYTCIVIDDTVEVLHQPSLKRPIRSREILSIVSTIACEITT